ncbi:MAG: site-specific integrase [Sphingobacteriales bacterium]|nr:site-specific integrase [Sphingobacteriales bacterium]OJW00199.1 MAG: hypothetical protein BGO52_03690 [Sphingobacteriales bacterium 44-61]
MQVHQNLSLLFYRKKKKADKQGYIPIYCRVTITGVGDDEMSTGCKVLYDQWDDENKEVLPVHPSHKLFNKKLGQIKADLERHFDLVVAKNGCASPSLVIKSYKTPPLEQQRQLEKKENLLLTGQVDDIIDRFVKHCRLYDTAFREGTPAPEKVVLLEEKKELLLNEIEDFISKARKIFDDRAWVKTLGLAIDELLLYLLELVISGHRSRHTLEKLWGRKRRLLSFLQLRYKLTDIPLAQLEHKFITELVRFSLTHYENQENTAMKYALFLKEIIDRTVANGWLLGNVFTTFQCTYKKPRHEWPTMHEVIELINWNFEEYKLNEIRDIQIFQCFNGLSYAEVYSLKPGDIIAGIDKKKWIRKDRQKTGGDETLPLLPICLDIMKKYENHPVCVRRGKLLPVPSNQEYNRCLKKIMEITGIRIKLSTHKARYFFANEVTYNLGVPLKTIASMLGQSTVSAVENYVEPNKVNISQNMDMVEAKLYGEGGPLAPFAEPLPATGGAKIIPIGKR